MHLCDCRYTIFCLSALLLIAGHGVVRKRRRTRSRHCREIEIKTSVDLAEAYIGDLITYTMTITYDSTIELVPPPLGANLGAFDVKDYQADVRRS